MTRTARAMTLEEIDEFNEHVFRARSATRLAKFVVGRFNHGADEELDRMSEDELSDVTRSAEELLAGVVTHVIALEQIADAAWSNKEEGQ